ncbi:hypothetical protein GJ688_11930 [Heliobacillus mobilis]|uniref:Uncharacterized protein n=1 Tax=Heliobacterium mobile TaxID=28064 RepID=A0A6I3SL99_HELMO|nr:hypothetical protein [Heliobacterium mobile]MTV49684.1 hypothetical protein [Heliobacterium mobile]
MEKNGGEWKKSAERAFLPSIADLIDILTIDQIKEVLLTDKKSIYAEEMKKLEHDIDLIIEENKVQLSARKIRMIIVLAQMNLHIWKCKDKMQEESERYAEYLTLAHQLNGIRNQIKNMLLDEFGEANKASKKTNDNTDDLEGWLISI